MKRPTPPENERFAEDGFSEWRAVAFMIVFDALSAIAVISAVVSLAYMIGK